MFHADIADKCRTSKHLRLLLQWFVDDIKRVEWVEPCELYNYLSYLAKKGGDNTDVHLSCPPWLSPTVYLLERVIDWICFVYRDHPEDYLIITSHQRPPRGILSVHHTWSGLGSVPLGLEVHKLFMLGKVKVVERVWDYLQATDRELFEKMWNGEEATALG